MNEELQGQILDWIRTRFFGKYRGLVVNNVDPTSKGRLLVTVPAVLDAIPVWAMPCVPYAGTMAGQYFIPEIGAGVWVEFEGGDPSYPIWVGTFWADGETPTNELNAPPNPLTKVLRTASGLMLTMDDNGQRITLSDAAGLNILSIEVLQGTASLKGLTRAVVDAPMVELTENAVHPVVLGDALLQYLNQLVGIFQSHTHPGETAMGMFPVTPAPPVPPMPLATPDLLSFRVKTG